MNSNAKEKLDLELSHWTFVAIASLVFWLYIIYYAFTQEMAQAQFGALFLGYISILYILDELLEPIKEKEVLQILILIINLAILLITTYYFYTNYLELHTVRVGFARDHEYVLAAMLVSSMIYLTWREFGRTFLILIVGVILYGSYGMYAPGVLSHGGLNSQRLLQIMVLEFEGLYGYLTRLVATWLALFLLYAGLLQAYGAFDLILRFAIRSVRYIRSGVAQSAVISSMIIGSINGSHTANAGITGSFTIPLMKENGMKSETAAGIESTASCFGQVLPPVMGAAAFIMAGLLGIRYIDVLVAGILPAAILVASISVAVHYTSIAQVDIDKQNVNLENFVEDTLSKRELAIEAVRFLIPLFTLVYVLGVLQFTVITSALYTCIAMLITGIGFPIIQAIVSEGQSLSQTVRKVSVDTINGSKLGALSLAPIAIVLAAINGVVDILLATGVPSAIALALIQISGGVLIVALILSMIICIILGLGMPTSAAYLIMALLVAPALINQFGIPELAAHYFVFYATITAGITPPVATAVAVASGIAQSNFWRACHEALKIASPLFILPFVFIYHPELVSVTYNIETLITATFTLIGAISMIHGLNYHGRISTNVVVSTLARGLYVVLGVFIMAYPSLLVKIVLLALVMLLITYQLRDFITVRLGSSTTSDD
ncbi:TRAP transporter permease [Natronorarus salvus]|uniref:TRAP transporter permease n=1 Tax=Natronorarus salvus TaxID=3117733 RepID=UPI002F26CC73